ncbi:MAG TPA: Hsp70 family protein, partial [Candidatus Paceibacterota bacterium]|nr:Hsp70 family protein [Candidatus Paceibacterota bacterium]
VIPLTLGIETMGGVATKLIDKNTTIPTTKSQIFSTAADNQTQVEIHIVQGERAMANDNKSLGRFILDGIPPAPRGMPQVEVSFDVDANGILNVTAKDKATNKAQSIRIEAGSGLSEDDIKKMQKDAEMHAEEDKKKKELIDTKNLSEQMIYTAEKAIKDAGDKITSEIKKTIEDKINNLKELNKKDDIELIKKASSELSEEMQKIGQHINQQQNNSTKEEEKKDDVRDAEVEEKESKKDENK